MRKIRQTANYPQLQHRMDEWMEKACPQKRGEKKRGKRERNIERGRERKKKKKKME